MDRNESDFTFLKQTKPEPELATKPRFYFNWSLVVRIVFYFLALILCVLVPWWIGYIVGAACIVYLFAVYVFPKNPKGR